MKRKEEQRYVDKHWKTLKRGLKDYLATGDQDALHEFRVEVKKMRAFLVLQPNVKLTKDFKPVKKIFKHAGDIRNTYLNVQLGAQYDIDDEDFVSQQHQKLEQTVNDFKLNGEKYIKTVKDGYHNLSDRVESVPNLHINLFYERQLHQIANKLLTITFDETLHHSRKLIKELLYNYKLFKPVLEMQLNERYLDDMQEAIGNWHDNTLAALLFKDNTTVTTSLKKEQAKLKRKIGNLAKDFFEKATTTTELALQQVD
jgi:CHAD domain-containing protein